MSHHPQRLKGNESPRLSRAPNKNYCDSGSVSPGNNEDVSAGHWVGPLAQGRGRGRACPQHFLGSPTDLPQCKRLNSIQPLNLMFKQDLTT